MPRYDRSNCREAGGIVKVGLLLPLGVLFGSREGRNDPCCCDRKSVLESRLGRSDSRWCIDGSKKDNRIFCLVERVLSNRL